MTHKQYNTSEEYVSKVQTAILAHDPNEADTLDELALQRAAYYIYFNFADAFPDDGNVYNIYDIVKFTSPFRAPCGHQAYKQVTTSPRESRSVIACGHSLCNNYWN